MRKTVKTIGILTSGGDAPGMNAAVRAVARSAMHRGVKVVGVRRGFQGLITRETFSMNLRTVSEIIGRGGTVLFSSRCPEFETAAGMEKAVANCRSLNLDGIVALGGDGTFRGARELNSNGIKCIGIPVTIDNDIGCSEYTIGFDTALNTAVEMIDRIRDTSQSHDRCTVVEVMGRGAGYLALNAGIACGAGAVLLPEILFDIEKDVVAKILASKKTGKKHFIVVVAEGVGEVSKIAEYISERTGIVSRSSVLGHVQRGGSPSGLDRNIATRMGHRAAELFSENIGGRIIALKGGEVVDYDIDIALEMKKTLDRKLVCIAEDVSI